MVSIDEIEYRLPEEIKRPDFAVIVDEDYRSLTTIYIDDSTFTNEKYLISYDMVQNNKKIRMLFHSKYVKRCTFVNEKQDRLMAEALRTVCGISI